MEQFSKWVLDIGDGALPAVTRGDESEPTWVTIPEDLLIHTDGDAVVSLISEVYPNLLEKYMDPTYLSTRAIVCPNNLTTDKINDYIVSMLPGHGVECLSCDTISKSSECIPDFDMLYPTEFLNSINATNFPCHKLVLKRGVTVMLLRNLNQTAGLCNGTRMLVTEIGHRVLRCMVLTPSGVGEEVFIPRIALNTTDVKWPFTLQRRQFPIRICYAMTINKSQGQTLSTVGLYLDKPVFTHGQLYVAVSRVTSRSGLRILIENPDGSCRSQTRNVVYREVLQAVDAVPHPTS
jgi:ATP-dependent DNA helicase PIF1